MPNLRVRNDVIVRKARIDLRLEYLDLLAGDLCPAQTANQFFRLAGEHRPGYHFDPAGGLARGTGVLAPVLNLNFFRFVVSDHRCCGAHRLKSPLAQVCEITFNSGSLSKSPALWVNKGTSRSVA